MPGHTLESSKCPGRSPNVVGAATTVGRLTLQAAEFPAAQAGLQHAAFIHCHPGEGVLFGDAAAFESSMVLKVMPCLHP